MNKIKSETLENNGFPNFNQTEKMGFDPRALTGLLVFESGSL